MARMTTDTGEKLDVWGGKPDQAPRSQNGVQDDMQDDAEEATDA